MGLFSDEKKYGKVASKAAALEGEGGPARDIRKRGTAYDGHSVESTSLRNLLDSVSTFRAGR